MTPKGRSDDDGGRRELARGTIELAVLAALNGGRRYGYELLTHIATTSGGSPQVKEGTVYPVLHRLEDGGYVRSSWNADGRAAPRKYYTLTKSGVARLAELRAEWDRLVAGMRRLLKEVD